MRRRLTRYWRVLIGLSVLVIFGLIASGYVIRTSRIDLSTGGVADWPYYGRDQEGTRYAPLDQINRGNVGYLEKTWEYHTGDFSDGSDGRPKTTFQATPILVDGVLYLATVYGRVIALNPETGAEIWTYDPEVDPTVDRGEFANRGVTYWQAVARVARATVEYLSALSMLGWLHWTPNGEPRVPTSGTRGRWICPRELISANIRRTPESTGSPRHRS